jgi:hypothetical protein
VLVVLAGGLLSAYGKTSAYKGFSQGDIYKAALGGTPVLISPRGFY